MVEATSPSEGILWHKRECREDSDLRCHNSILPRGYHQTWYETGGWNLWCVENFECSITGEDAACWLAEYPWLGEKCVGQVHSVGVSVQGLAYKMSLSKLLTDFRGQ